MNYFILKNLINEHIYNLEYFPELDSFKFMKKCSTLQYLLSNFILLKIYFLLILSYNFKMQRKDVHKKPGLKQKKIITVLINQLSP